MLKTRIHIVLIIIFIISSLILVFVPKIRDLVLPRYVTNLFDVTPKLDPALAPLGIYLSISDTEKAKFNCELERLPTPAKAEFFWQNVCESSSNNYVGIFWKRLNFQKITFQNGVLNEFLANKSKKDGVYQEGTFYCEENKTYKPSKDANKMRTVVIDCTTTIINSPAMIYTNFIYSYPVEANTLNASPIIVISSDSKATAAASTENILINLKKAPKPIKESVRNILKITPVYASGPGGSGGDGSGAGSGSCGPGGVGCGPGDSGTGGDGVGGDSGGDGVGGDSGGDGPGGETPYTPITPGDVPTIPGPTINTGDGGNGGGGSTGGGSSGGGSGGGSTGGGGNSSGGGGDSSGGGSSSGGSSDSGGGSSWYDWWWYDPGPPAPNPQVLEAYLDGNNCSDAVLSITCSDSTGYTVKKSDNSTLFSGTYSGNPVTTGPVQEEDNYIVTCTNGGYQSSPVYRLCANNLFVTQVANITANPRSLKKGASTALTWDIENATSTCRIKATPLYPALCNATTCKAPRDQAAQSLTNILATGNTDANDPYWLRNGTTRTMISALTEPAHNNTHAKGRKTLPIEYSTTFTLQCGTMSTRQKVDVLITDEVEQ